MRASTGSSVYVGIYVGIYVGVYVGVYVGIYVGLNILTPHFGKLKLPPADFTTV